MKADHPNGYAFFLKGNKHGCLLLHGFTGTPGHMRWIGEKLNEKGYTVSAPLLPGHGTTLSEMRSANWHMWLAAARLAYTQLRERCERVTVIGLSMGGTLAVILAEEYPVDGLICISPAIKLWAKAAWIAPLLAWMTPRKRNKTGQDADMLDDFDCGYDHIPMGKVYDLGRLILLARSNLFAVVAPTLIIQPVNDQTVHPDGAKHLYKGISSREKELMWLAESGHMCTIGAEREEVMEAIINHICHVDDTKSLAI